MLPDYPETKRELFKQIEAQAHSGVEHDPLLSQIRRFKIHEGRVVRIAREDGSVDELRFDDPILAKATFKIEDVRRLGERSVFAAVEKLGADLHEGMAKRLFQTITKAAESVGNVRDAKGAPITAESILEMLDKMEMSFDENGAWNRPTIITGPGLAEPAKAAYLQLEEDPSLRVRRDAIVNRKREEWRVREARRKLVD